MKAFSLLFSLPLILLLSCHLCVAKGDEFVFDPYISTIPDSISTDQQIMIKETLKEIAYTKVSVSGDRYVFHFNRNDFEKRGVSGKYCGWLKRNIREENRNYRRLMRQNPDIRYAVSLEDIFELSKKEFLEHSERTDDTEVMMTDIFQYGTPINCPEDNIRNLFRNWIAYGVDKGNIQLLSYDYEGVVDNISRLKKYVRHNHGVCMPSWSYSCTMGDDVLRIETVRSERKKRGARRYAFGALLAHFVSRGDHVFSVKFSYYGKEHVYYIFIKPDTNRVVTMFNMFEITFPDLC